MPLKVVVSCKRKLVVRSFFSSKINFSIYLDSHHITIVIMIIQKKNQVFYSNLKDFQIYIITKNCQEFSGKPRNLDSRFNIYFSRSVLMIKKPWKKKIVGYQRLIVNGMHVGGIICFNNYLKQNY